MTTKGGRRIELLAMTVALGLVMFIIWTSMRWSYHLLIVPISWIAAITFYTCLNKKVEAKRFRIVEGRIVSIWPKVCWHNRKTYREMEDPDGHSQILSYAREVAHYQFMSQGEHRIVCTFTLCREEDPNTVLHFNNVLRNMHERQVKDLRSFTCYFVHEFVNKYKNGFERFYNPFDAEQQEQFRNEVQVYLDEFLGQYTKVSGVLKLGAFTNFDIPTDVPSNQKILV